MKLLALTSEDRPITFHKGSYTYLNGLSIFFIGCAIVDM